MPLFEEIPDPRWEPEVLRAKAKSIKRNAIIGVVVGTVGVGIFPFNSIILGVLLGGYAIYCGRDALNDINVYGVERIYRRVAQAAQILGGFGIVLPIARVFLLFLGN